MGYSVKATGTLAMPGAAKGTPQSVSYKGSVAVNGQTIEGTVDAKLSGKPTITADLKSAMMQAASGGVDCSGLTSHSRPLSMADQYTGGSRRSLSNQASREGFFPLINQVGKVGANLPS